MKPEVGHAETKVSREFKVEAVKLVRDRGYPRHKPGGTWTFMRTSCASG